MKNLTKTALVAATLFAATATTVLAAERQAFTDYVHRTNTEASPGQYVPTLVISVDGNKSAYKLGEAGLTRSTIYNEDKAKAWAEAMVGVDLTAKGHIRYERKESDSEVVW